jgi:hypothetical protein
MAIPLATPAMPGFGGKAGGGDEEGGDALRRFSLDTVVTPFTSSRSIRCLRKT